MAVDAGVDEDEEEEEKRSTQPRRPLQRRRRTPRSGLEVEFDGQPSEDEGEGQGGGYTVAHRPPQHPGVAHVISDDDAEVEVVTPAAILSAQDLEAIERGTTPGTFAHCCGRGSEHMA